MTKVKYLNWDTLSKKVSMKGHTKDFQFRATTNLFSRLLVIAKSGRDINLPQAISDYEFSNNNLVLIKPDGNLHPCGDLIHELESLVGNKECAQEVPSPISKRYLIIDGMVVVQILMSVHTFGTCKDLGNEFVIYINSLRSK